MITKQELIDLIRDLNLDDPDPHSYEGEWEALIAGKESARQSILRALEDY